MKQPQTGALLASGAGDHPPRPKLRLAPFLVSLGIAFAGGVLGVWIRPHHRILTPVFVFLIGLCISLAIRPWRSR